MPVKNYNMIADYDFWVKFENWNIDQMTSLLLGYNPLYFDKTLIANLREGIVETSMSEKDIDILLDDYDKMNALIIDSVKAGALKLEATPLQFYKWTQIKNIPIFNEFRQAIYNNKSNSQSNITDKRYNPKRKQQLYKIILSLAIKYKFNPENNKNPSTSKFRNAIERAGLSIDDNTIREVVNTSYDLYKDNIDHTVFKN